MYQFGETHPSDQYYSRALHQLAMDIWLPKWSIHGGGHQNDQIISNVVGPIDVPPEDYHTSQDDTPFGGMDDDDDDDEFSMSSTIFSSFYWLGSNYNDTQIS